MVKNFSVLFAVVLVPTLINGALAFSLKVDIGESGQTVKPGWEEFSGAHSNDADPASYLVDGLSIAVALRTGVLGDSGYRNYGGGDLGGDMLYPNDSDGPVNGRVILTLSNLPVGNYTLTSYHNDTKDTHAQQDPIDVTVGGAITGSVSDLGVVQTKSLDDAGLGSSTVTFIADGTGDVVVTYSPTTNNGIVSKAVINGFELDISGSVVPAVEFDTAVSAGFETVPAVMLSVSLSVASANTVTVDYSITGGTAVGGEDYYLAAGTLQFDPCETTEYINISVVDDGLPEDDETLEVTLSDPVNAQLGSNIQHTYTILDTSPTVAFDTAASEGREDVSPVNIPVSLSWTWPTLVTVDYNVTGGTAISGEDYNLPAGTLQFEPGEVAKYISINIVDDGLNEDPDETIEITLSDPSNAKLGTNAQHTFTILPPILYPQRCPAGDLDGDCDVDSNDLGIFVGQWLDPPGSCSGSNCANLDNSNGVDMSDFALLAANWLKVGTPVMVNEFMASNSRTQEDPNEAGEYPDWIELYNAGTGTIDLGGMYLTDNLSDPNKWQIPAGVSIEPGGYQLFWADNDEEQGDTHTNFQLNSNGEEIGLFDSDGKTLLDVVYFNHQLQSKDVSYGRFPDGSENWRALDMRTDPHPTPGQANEGFAIVINEIMYHPSSENPLEEYIELYNRGSEGVDLSNWRFTDGVDFLFPPGTTLDVNSYLVVTADVNVFSAKYPGVTNMVGQWSGKLSNKGESIELVNAAGTRVDKVVYSDEGDWSVRLRGPLDYGHYGWVWSDAHDGGGRSLELINPYLTNWYGQNWAASTVEQGTPGTINSVMSADVPPLILDVVHQPIIPGPNDPVTVRARVLDELSSGITMTVHYRVDDTGSPFGTDAMYDDGLHGDGAAGDGVYGAQLPAYPSGSVIEFYVEDADAGDNSRTWPGPVPGFGQVTNMLYQVDASFDPCAPWVPGSQPIYYLILTEQERAELEDLGDDTQNDEDKSNAQMNATFISRDATGIDLRYNVGVRNRGHGSRHDPPMNYRVNFPDDRAWKDVTSVNLNSKFAHLQWLGSAAFHLAGMPAPDVTIVQVRVNGENLILADPRAYGSYAAMEVKNSEWAENHFPNDSNGNVYRCIREDGGEEADLRYEGTDPNSYRDTYFKKTNEEEDNWSDLINLTDVLNNAANKTYFQDVNQVINIDEWMHYLALDTLMINCESGLNTGQGDDYALYRGTSDTRFILVNHDQDTYLRQGDHPECNEEHDIFTYTQVNGLYRLLYHPDFVPRYYQAFFDLFEAVYNPCVMNQLIDDGLGGYVPVSRRDAMKQVIVDRIAGVLAQIPHELTIVSALPFVNGFYCTTSNVTTLTGTANAAQTRSVLANGVLADWSPVDGTWSVDCNVALNPGINRILVETLDAPNGVGNEMDSNYIDIWYDDGSESLLSGVLGVNTIMDAASGPWHVTGDVTVQAGVTLTIEPGTTVFFDSGTGITVNGRLLAEGTRYERIRLMNVPGSASWDGLAFSNSQEDSRISCTDMECGDGQGESILINGSQLLLDNITWAGTNSTVLELSNPSLLVRNSVFPSIGGSEVIHGSGMPANGYLVLEGNTFGAVSGNADVIDFTGGKRPGPILQVYDNVFLGGEDDGLDLDGTDAHIEGNIFTNFHYNGGEPSGTGNAIATGEADDANSQVTVVRNIFYDNDHAALLKENCFMHAENNVFYGCTIAVVNFDEPGHALGPGKGAYMDGNIFWNNTSVFQNFYPAVTVTVHRSILPAALHYLGSGNIDAEPLLADPDNGDFSLLAGSPALGTGPNGLDMGAMVPAGASISGEPPAVTYQTEATLTVGGPGIIAYRYRVNDEPTWSAERSVDVPIELTDMNDGFSYTVYAVGKNSAGRWQGEDQATASKTWTVDLNAGLNPHDVVINELLAHSNAPPYVDWIELHNTTNTEIDLSGWFLSDSNNNLMKYQIANGTTIAPNGYIVFYEDQHFGQGSGDPGSHTAFALSENGETVYLSSGVPGEMTLTGYQEHQKFGASEPDVTFGRYYKSSTETYDFVAMNSDTPGWANSYPKVGPIVISEIMYHSQINGDAEYVELANISGRPVTLYDFDTNEPWKFEDEGGFEFFFPTNPVTLADGNCILLVKDLAAFNSEFTARPGTQLFEWGPSGSLRNSSEEIQLSMPGDLDGGERQYILVDSTKYSDGSHDEYFPNLPGDPWPTGPDGTGKSLTRRILTNYGNDVINWDANDPSPGAVNP